MVSACACLLNFSHGRKKEKPVGRPRTSTLVRFGAALDADLLKSLDVLAKKRGSRNGLLTQIATEFVKQEHDRAERAREEHATWDIYALFECADCGKKWEGDTARS